jgi:hypothetical protein
MSGTTGGREIRDTKGAAKTGDIKTGWATGKHGNPVKKSGEIFGKWTSRRKSGSKPPV